jgi:hypothetical protein
MAFNEPISNDQDVLTSGTSAVQTVGASDILMASLFTAINGFPNYARRIVCCVSGTIGIKRINDASFVPYPCFQGDRIDGRIIAVGSTSDGSSAGMQFIAEQ